MLQDFRAYQLSKDHYRLCKQLRMPGFLYDQLLRASSSVVLNLAEGSGKRTEADQKKFYSIALGSLRECRAILEIEDTPESELLKTNHQLGGMIYRLIHRPQFSENSKPRPLTQTETGTVNGQQAPVTPQKQKAPRV